MSYNEIVQTAWEAVDEIKQSPSYRDFTKAQNSLATRADLILLVEAFRLAKERYEEVAKYGKFHPDLPEASKRLQLAKTTLYQTPEYQSYIQAKTAIDQELQAFSDALNKILEPLVFGATHSCSTR